MPVKYVRIEPGKELPNVAAFKPFRAVVVVDDFVSSTWQSTVSAWLVGSGCLYMMAWGRECSSWDDSVDFANLEVFDFKDIPDDQFVMTTWHEDEALTDVFWYSKHCALHPTVELQNTLLVHIGTQDREAEFMVGYEVA